MQCPKCYAQDKANKVCTVTTRTDLDNNIIRRRACKECDYRWYTVEVPIPAEAVGHGRSDSKLATTFELKGSMTWNKPEELQ